ncbi:MAG TPA: hypothetical protein VM123_08260 [archaeon]|nr:hypothetical protein [archaeon]
MEPYSRKLKLLALLLAVYTGISFWVPYSKTWFMQDVMETQARLFFAIQSTERLRDYLISRAENLDIPVKREKVTVQNINGEIVYIELQYDLPLDILFYHSTLHFEPKIFSLIRSFDMKGTNASKIMDVNETLAALSDSTKQFLSGKGVKDYFLNFFAK